MVEEFMAESQVEDKVNVSEKAKADAPADNHDARGNRASEGALVEGGSSELTGSFDIPNTNS